MKISKRKLVPIFRENPYDRFELQAKIATGKGGSVLKVFDKHLQLTRVLKEVKATVPENLVEVSMLRSLSHPNILDLYEVYSFKRNTYLVTEVLNGDELFESISQKNLFGERKVKLIARQMLQAVNYLHSNNIIHRDIKPENIVFKQNSSTHVKLIDFGSAVKLDYFSEIKEEFIGTCYYMAPEVSLRKYNYKCDIWSLGVVIYMLLSGRAPFNGKTPEIIMKKVTSVPASFDDLSWKGISYEATDMVKKMLSKNPDTRLDAEECLAHPWFTDLKTSFQENQEVMLSRIESFVSENKLKQSLIALISVQLDNFSRKQQLFKCFYDIDENNNGTMEEEEFVKMVEIAGGDERNEAVWK